jgi:hypothetical protein
MEKMGAPKTHKINTANRRKTTAKAIDVLFILGRVMIYSDEGID